MKRWITYLEDNKMKAFEVSDGEAQDARDIIEECGSKVVGYTVSARTQSDAIFYTELALC